MMSPFHIAAFLILQQTTAQCPCPIPQPMDSSAIYDMVRNSGAVAIAVLVVLLIASLYTWAVILGKSPPFAVPVAQSRRFRARLPQGQPAARDCGGQRAVQAQPAGERVR